VVFGTKGTPLLGRWPGSARRVRRGGLQSGVRGRL